MRARGPRPAPVGRRPGWVGRGRTSSLVPLLIVVLALAGCNATSEASPSTGSSAIGSGAPYATPTELASEPPSIVASDEPSTEPTVEPSAEPTDEPTPTDTPTEAPTAGGSPSVGGTDACFGSSQTRDDFFAVFAADVSWPVYCAVLPKGWSVEDGQYHLKNGGRLWISYRRRSDGAKVVLDQGSVCAETTPCVPTGDDLGSIPFGDRQAALSSTAGGTLSAVVDETENPAWLLTGSGIDAKDFKTIAAKLHLLDQ